MYDSAIMRAVPSSFPDPLPLPGVQPEPFQTTRPEWLIRTGRFSVDATYGVLRRKGIREHIVLATTAGAGLVATEGAWVSCLPGSLIVLPPGHPHYYATRQATGYWEFTWAHFFPRPHWTWLHQWQRAAPGILKEHRSGAPFDPIEMAVLDKMHHYRLTGGTTAEELSLNALEEILLLHTPTEQQQRTTDERLLAVVQRVIADPSKPYPIAELAKIAGLSTSRFAHLFREEMGESPQQFVERIRLDTAASALIAGGRTVSQIAEEAGYPSPFYFSRRFKARFGLSPIQYRHQDAQARLT